MYRNAFDKLEEWKTSSHRKPLVLQGARQVGKTWLIREFGKTYKHFFYFNFEETNELISLFENSLEPKSIIQNLSLYIGKPINHKDSLIFFDEIQSAPRAMTSLKYFYESAPEFHVIVAGSLLGVSVGKSSSFPVGKVTFLTIYPMSFSEFLHATGDKILIDYVKTLISSPSPSDIIHDKLIKLYRTYLFVGGMPEVVESYIKKGDPNQVRELQIDILKAYEKDFSKYSNAITAIKIAEIWQSVPYQIAKENKKFKYADVKKKTRAAHYEQAVEWLRSAGLIQVVNQLRDIKLPLNGYKDTESFKIYLVDTGLLGAILGLKSATILDPSALFKEYNGAFVENFVCQELICSGVHQLFYWTYERGIAEVDFIFQNDDQIIPIEVKSGTNTNTAGLKTYQQKYKPAMIYRASPRNLHKSDDFINIPLYAVSCLLKDQHLS